MDLANNTILITGGATGIGLALASKFLERGNSVVVCGRSAETLQKAVSLLPRLATIQCDITDVSSRAAMVRRLEAEHPSLNVLINNAGVQHRRRFGGEDALANLDEEVATNLTAPIHLIGALLPLLHRQPRAAIVNVTSGLAFAPLADVPVYCATKAALHSFTLSLRHQLKATRIRVVEIAPPMVETGLGSRPPGAPRPPMMTPEACAAEALAQLAQGAPEILVGSTVLLRQQGEAMFDRMNGQRPASP
jgi:uncharacterized oxidoreductase